jgi:hypothetical protein
VLGGETRGSYVDLYVGCSKEFLVQRLREFPTSLQQELSEVIGRLTMTALQRSSRKLKRKENPELPHSAGNPPLSWMVGKYCAIENAAAC